MCAVTGPDDPFSCMESTISCTGSYDANGILYWRTNVGGAFGFCWDAHRVDGGQATMQGILCEGDLVLVQNLIESLAIHFIVESIRLTQDLLNLCTEPGLGFFCS